MWLVDKLLQILDNKVKISVLVHEAYLINKNVPKYFVKVTNLSPQNIFTITHVYVKDKNKEIDILNPNRPLPHKLNPSEQWETWFDKELIEDSKTIFDNVYVVLTNRKKPYKSRKNTSVRPAGFVA